MPDLNEICSNIGQTVGDIDRLFARMQQLSDDLKQTGCFEHESAALDRCLNSLRHPASDLRELKKRVAPTILSIPPEPNNRPRMVRMKPVKKKNRLHDVEYEKMDDIIASGMKQMVSGQKFKAATFANAIAKRSHMTTEQVKRRLSRPAFQHEMRYTRCEDRKGWYQMIG